MIAVGFKRFAGGDDLKAGDFSGVTMVFPADQARNEIPIFHPGPLEDPMGGLGDDPVGGASGRSHRARADEQTLIGAMALPVFGILG